VTRFNSSSSGPDKLRLLPTGPPPQVAAPLAGRHRPTLPPADLWRPVGPRFLSVVEGADSKYSKSQVFLGVFHPVRHRQIVLIML
jgi:hypothetical protein